MIDAHHHIWRQADLIWLQGPEQPRIFGSYCAIKRDYPIAEYLEDIAGTGIERSVYVQANWPPQKFAEEAAWVQSVADEHGWPHAMVGYADFTSDDACEQLRWLSIYPLMRGVRQQFHWHENPAFRFAARRDLPADPAVHRNIARLADYGWTFDLQVFSGQMAHAAVLARACPEATFILQHAGMLEDQSTEGWTQWREGMKQLADCQNVVTKLSAFGTFIRRNDPDFIARMVGETVAIFGTERCMFGSNFPIEKIWTSYRQLWSAPSHGCRTATAKC
jgi:predicted TIM-barrel fold metal-dependent hydrolase